MKLIILGKVGTTGGTTSGGMAHGGMASGGYNVDNTNVATQTDPGFAPQSGTQSENHNLKSSGVAPAGSSYITPGSGTAQKTAGPHNSDLLNKLDPRVDSNLDNSRTIGRDATRS